MDRRNWLKKASIVAGATALGSTNSFSAKKSKYKWRLVLAVPKTLPIWGEQVVQFAKNIKAMSSGRLDIRVYGAGELVPALGGFDAVKSGSVEMSHSASYYWQGKMPASVYFTTIPFGMSAEALGSWIDFGGGQKLWDELYSPHGVMAYKAGNTGMQMGGWFRKKITGLSDFKGLKMRIPGLGGKVIEKAGGKPILVAGGEIFSNLTTGVIDATEWVGPYHDYIMGFYKAAKYYYYPGWHEPGASLELLISKKAWNQLPKDLQAIVRVGAKHLDQSIHYNFIQKDSEYFAKIRQNSAIQILPFPEKVLKSFKGFSEEIEKDIIKTNPLAKKINESYHKFQELYDSHQNVTKNAFIKSGIS